ncbi:YbjN domain-containing protein [Roseofilum sp. BLCC_M154]|uniref:YbjN domain-containing protein n=1 Tax=Roseofilum acuticapitatum BLCC-M154 TaxID=3022444 RepID=A0ABT7AZQ2_9CYAN|nr:YbjN domain-containing protein [Roseofilum acuticapitatum]MDJ1171771.1 YbjN domain-containing protein [Roseofilum acuticapitatum BLCC-M154]
MTDRTLELNEEIIFDAQHEAPLRVQGVNLQVKLEDELQEVRLRVEVDGASYAQIEDNNQFNLEKRWRGEMVGAFLSDRPLYLDLMLQPDRVPDPIPDHLRAILTPEVLQSERWLALSVYQEVEGERVGYDTFWQRANLTQLTQAVQMGAQALETLFNTVQEGLETEFSQMEEGGFAGFMRQLEEWTEEEEETSLEAVVRDFFEQDDWEFIQVEPGRLQLAFQGEKGRWRCYARIHEGDKQFLFYSLFPVAVPEGDRRLMAELLTQANYGMILGNFELDFTDGELRYKTSIDVEGDRLTVALVRSLVYANVTIMDRYLPAIVAVLEGSSISEAIARVE